MNEAQMPERIFVRTEDNIHHITGWGKLATHFNPTIDTEYIRKDLSVSDGWNEKRLQIAGMIMAARSSQSSIHPAQWAQEALDAADALIVLASSPPKDSPTSDGLEHSQHKCGEEIAELKRQLDGATFVQKKWDEREEVIKVYREALERLSKAHCTGNCADFAKEVLTRMEGKG